MAGSGSDEAESVIDAAQNRMRTTVEPALAPGEDDGPPREFVPRRPSREGATVDLIRPEPSLLVDRGLPPHAQDRWVDHGLALLLRDRLRTGSPSVARPITKVLDRRRATHRGPALDPPTSQHETSQHETFQRPAPERPAPRVPAASPGPRRRLREPALGLPLAVLIGLVAAFVGWVSAGPFWLANGGGTNGTATVVRCEAKLLGDRCTGRFVANDGSLTVAVRLASLDPLRRTPGAQVDARILHPDSDVAYAGSVAGLHLRWILGFGLVLGCGAVVGAATGVPRLRREGQRRRSILWGLSFGGPLLLLLTMVLLALV